MGKQKCKTSNLEDRERKIICIKFRLLVTLIFVVVVQILTKLSSIYHMNMGRVVQSV